MSDGDPNPVELVTASGAGPGKDELTPSQPARVQLGVIATPNLAGETLAQLADELTTLLSERYPGVRWEVARVSDPLVAPPVQVTELVDAARTRLLDAMVSSAVPSPHSAAASAIDIAVTGPAKPSMRLMDSHASRIEFSPFSAK